MPNETYYRCDACGKDIFNDTNVEYTGVGVMVVICNDCSDQYYLKLARAEHD